jgi:hypothetical protein
MKKFGIVGTALLLIIAAVSAQAGPRLTVSSQEFNFGKTVQNATISHSFWLYSTGDDTLRVTEVKPGCGCTQAPLDRDVLAPGDSARLEILFKTGRYSGSVTKRPTIFTNMSRDPLFLEINSIVMSGPDSAYPVRLQPSKLDVSQFTQEPRRRASFLVENLSAKDYDLKLIDYPDQFFEVKLPNRVKAGETVEGEIIVREDKIEQGFERSFTFMINDESGTRFTLPVERMYRIKKADAGQM